MTFDPYNIPLTPSQWFSTIAEYDGQGTAELEDPKGAIFGKAKVRHDEFGESGVEFRVEGAESERELKFGIMELLSGRNPVKENGRWTLPIGFIDNPCSKIIIETSIGKYVADGVISCMNCRFSSNPEEGTRLVFRPLHSKFEVKNAAQPKYWVIPLSNFRSTFSQRHLNLDRHPLRIYPTPDIPDGLQESELFAATLNANRKNNLIIFEFNGSLGFIEPLPDYEERVKRLVGRIDRQRTTAVMIGEVGDKPTQNFDDLLSWFPVDFIPLLELATGSYIGIPWIEIRDCAGNLVRRYHPSTSLPSYSKGHVAIDETIHMGTGLLLTKGQTSSHFGTSYVNTVISRMIKAGSHSGVTIEDKMVNLFQALDTLCEKFKLKSVTPEDALSQPSKEGVNKILKDTCNEIFKLSSHQESEGNTQDTDVLKKIAGQVKQACNLQVPFGKAVLRLLEKFGLPDGDIVTAHYKTHPRPDRREWHEVLSYYRAIPIHAGAFDLSSKKHDFNDLMRINLHLHDVLLRIIMKMLDYDGAYQPTVLKWQTGEKISWVNLSTPASKLGY
jgi:hypothetical protein